MFASTLFRVFLHSIWGKLTLYSKLSHTLLRVYSQFLFSVFLTHTFLKVYSNFSSSLLTLYSGFTHTLGFTDTLLWVCTLSVLSLPTFFSRCHSHFTLCLLTLYSWFTHRFLMVLLKLCTRLAHSFLWLHSYSSLPESGVSQTHWTKKCEVTPSKVYENPD